MSDTPRTDAFCRTPTEFNVGQEARLIPGWIDFARQLERELAAERDAHNATANNLGKALTRAEKAEAECERLREALESLRSTHYECDDPWYSCPKSEGGCANDGQGDECNCGADARNAIIDAALARKP